MSTPTKIILDVDTGIDDALAIGFTVRSPMCDLIAVTTLAGNSSVEHTTRNTLDVLHLMGRSDIPVHRGASHPLSRTHVDAAYWHDENGLGGAKLPPSPAVIGADRGPAAIIRLAKEFPGEITLVCVGPLTNLAIALNVEPTLLELLAGLVIMGGVFFEHGNITDLAEFNIYCDPEAAAQVFANDYPMVVVGLDVTRRTILHRTSYLATQSRSGEHEPGARLALEVARALFTQKGKDEMALHDPLAIGAALDPSLLTYQEASVEVGLGEVDRGQTRITGPGKIKVANGVNAEEFTRLFHDRMGLNWQRGGMELTLGE